jgi:hypothetical protein
MLIATPLRLEALASFRRITAGPTAKGAQYHASRDNR